MFPEFRVQQGGSERSVGPWGDTLWSDGWAKSLSKSTHWVEASAWTLITCPVVGFQAPRLPVKSLKQFWAFSDKLQWTGSFRNKVIWIIDLDIVIIIRMAVAFKISSLWTKSSGSWAECENTIFSLPPPAPAPWEQQKCIIPPSPSLAGFYPDGDWWRPCQMAGEGVCFSQQLCNMGTDEDRWVHLLSTLDLPLIF